LINRRASDGDISEFGKGIEGKDRLRVDGL
jgi:hypothetical protein